MITTVLGTCDYCGAENAEVICVDHTRDCEPVHACLSCRDERPELRKTDELGNGG